MQEGSFWPVLYARLPVPVYESAFALARLFEAKGTRRGQDYSSQS